MIESSSAPGMMPALAGTRSSPHTPYPTHHPTHHPHPPARLAQPLNPPKAGGIISSTKKQTKKQCPQVPFPRSRSPTPDVYFGIPSPHPPTSVRGTTHARGGRSLAHAAGAGDRRRFRFFSSSVSLFFPTQEISLEDWKKGRNVDGEQEMWKALPEPDHGHGGHPWMESSARAARA